MKLPLAFVIILSMLLGAVLRTPASTACTADLGGLTIIPKTPPATNKADRLDKIPKPDARRIPAREFAI